MQSVTLKCKCLYQALELRLPAFCSEAKTFVTYFGNVGASKFVGCVLSRAGTLSHYSHTSMGLRAWRTCFLPCQSTLSFRDQRTGVHSALRGIPTPLRSRRSIQRTLPNHYCPSRQSHRRRRTPALNGNCWNSGSRPRICLMARFQAAFRRPNSAPKFLRRRASSLTERRATSSSSIRLRMVSVEIGSEL